MINVHINPTHPTSEVSKQGPSFKILTPTGREESYFFFSRSVAVIGQMFSNCPT